MFLGTHWETLIFYQSYLDDDGSYDYIKIVCIIYKDQMLKLFNAIGSKFL